MENKDKIFKVKVLLETDCNACDAADCPVRAKLPVEYTSLAADAADQVAAHLSLLMETLLDGDEAEWIVNTLMFFKEEDESRTAIYVLHSMFIAAGYKKAARTTLEMMNIAGYASEAADMFISLVLEHEDIACYISDDYCDTEEED